MENIDFDWCEKRHIEDRLLDYCGVKDIEASAYLAGYISKFMY
jgi:hypothetical protein